MSLRESWVNRGDIPFVGALVLMIACAVAFFASFDNWLLYDQDISTTFLPNWTWLGQQLRDFSLPAWNRHFSSGTPGAGDPQAEWFYVPAMIAFTLFSTANAMKFMILMQALIGGIAMYFLGRLGFEPLAALAAGLGMGIGNPLYSEINNFTVGAQATFMAPVILLCIECAFRQRSLWGQLGWSAGAGIALSQVFMTFTGQGVLYSLGAAGVWMLWRAFVEPVQGGVTIRQRLASFAIIGASIVVLMAGFGAAGILPRIDFNIQSMVPWGDYSNIPGGDSNSRPGPLSWRLDALLGQTTWDLRPLGIGAGMFILGLLGLFTSRLRYCAWAAAVIAVASVEITLPHSILRPLLYLLPSVENLHGHRIDGSIWVIGWVPALLAGAGVQYVLRDPAFLKERIKFIVPALVLAGAGYIMWQDNFRLDDAQVVVAIIATAVLVGGSFLIANVNTDTQYTWRYGLCVGLIILMFANPLLVDVVRTFRDPGSETSRYGLLEFQKLGTDTLTQQNLEWTLSTTDAGGPGEFLKEMSRTEPPFRYVAYAGLGYNGTTNPYISGRVWPYVISSLTNGRAVYLGLEEVAGYNPHRLKYYFEYVNYFNGAQNYHLLDIFGPKIGTSQLLDMLNTRYIVSSNTMPDEWTNMAKLEGVFPRVYQNDQAAVFENTNAFDRAWVVHDVRFDPDRDALAALENRDVDGHVTAFVYDDVPEMGAGTGTFTDSVTITNYSANEMSMDVTSNGDGLVMISLPYERNWVAYVDGKKADVVRADYALSGVFIGDGRHTITLKYENRFLKIGMMTTGGTTLLMIGIWIAAFMERRRSRRDAGSQQSSDPETRA